MARRILTLTTMLLIVFSLGYGVPARPVLAQTAQASGADIKTNTSSNDKVIPSVASLPDLIIEGISWSPARPTLGSTVTFTVTVRNQGSAQAGNSRLAYFIDDAYRTSNYLSPLDPGASVSGTFTWSAQVGSHTVRAMADFDNEVTESNETNNGKTATFSTLAPDLTIEAITWSPENPSEGDTVTFSIIIKNKGSDRANSSRVYFYIDGASRGYQEVPGLEAGAATTQPFTWVARAGSHTLKATVDKDNWIAESDETNNEKTLIFLTSAPDLIIEAITWSPENPSASDNITFRVTIKNQGSGRASNFHVAYYIDDTYLDSASVNATGPGATANQTFNWIAQAGAHNIRAVADAYGKVTESDETNNEKTVVFSTIPPDLIIEAITWSPQSPSMTDEVTFTITIRNQGLGRAASSRVYLYIDGAPKGYQNVSQIEAGAAGNPTFTWIAEAGAHTIRAVADYNEEVAESDETNNEKTVTFSDISLPDLMVQDITWLPAGPSIGDTVTFRVTLKNQGGGKADYSYVAYYIDDAYLTSAYVGAIDSGTTANQTFTWTAEVGAHSIRAIADTNTRVAESDETNNEKTITFSPLAPDLIIETIIGSPSTPETGETVTFTLTIKNQGTDIASPSRVYFYVDDSATGYQNVPELAVNATATRTFTWITLAGLHAIKAVIDPDHEVTENDESNNEKRYSFPIPDLVIETLTGSPSDPEIGETVTFTLTIKNQGTDIADPSLVHFYVDGSAIGYQDIPELAPAATASRTFTWIAQAGVHAITAIADSNDVVAEGEENNNERTYNFPVLAPDLIIGAITWLPKSPSQSDNVTLTVTIKNQGTREASDFNVNYYVNDTYLASASVNVTEPEATVKKTFSWIAQAGDHTIKAIADEANRLTEIDESNNEQTVTLSISLPPPAPKPAPAPAPGPKAPQVPAEEPKFPLSLGKGLWLDVLFLLVATVLVGTFVIVLVRSRPRR